MLQGADRDENHQHGRTGIEKGTGMGTEMGDGGLGWKGRWGGEEEKDRDGDGSERWGMGIEIELRVRKERRER